jgi:hypothetical protein
VVLLGVCAEDAGPRPEPSGQRFGCQAVGLLFQELGFADQLVGVMFGA